MRSLGSRVLAVLGIGTGILIGSFMLRAQPWPDAPDGADLFQKKCSMCHGADGKGYAAIKTPDFTDPKVQASMTDAEMVAIIKNGKKGTPMPAFGDKLTEDEIKALVTFIRSLDSSKKK